MNTPSAEVAETDIRKSRPGDAAGIERLYGAAFPDEDLVPLVRELLVYGRGVISLVAAHRGAIAGHIVFSPCQVAAKENNVALLGPLAVAPNVQKQGIGSALIKAGFAALDNTGMDFVCVLGDPAYYGRFGFTVERRVATPYTLPDDWYEAWQSISLTNTAETSPEGTLVVAEPWRHVALWCD